MMFWWGEGMSWWGYVLMSVSMVLFWGVVILGIVALVRYLGHSAQTAGGTGRPDRSAEQVLAERFARGEIDEPEYQSRRAALRDRQQSPSGT